MKKIKINDKITYSTERDSYIIDPQYKEQNCIVPISVGFQVTRRCNLRCLHCAEDTSMADPTLREISHMLDNLKSGGVTRLNITGGEPLLRKDLLDILKLIKKKKFIASISTNGLLLTKEKIISFKPYIENIKISLHGLKRNNEAITRCDGHFEAVIEKINLLKKQDIPVVVIMSVMNINKDDIIPVAELCESLGVNKFFLFTLIPRGRGKILYDKQNISYSKLKSIMTKLAHIKKERDWQMEICLKDWSISGQCILLFPNGSLIGTPCLSEKDNTYVIGNILKRDLKEIWKTYPYKNNHIDYYRFH
jgi:MoaA/NifB/PqqE/SkfB family radical SAM enzyme